MAMFHIVLVEPEIPPNTGNIIRLCANCGARLHLIRPLGFDLTDKKLRRAGLDYHQLANVTVHDNFDAFIQKHGSGRIFACSTKGIRNYSDVQFQPGDTMVFGPETRGLSQEFLESTPDDMIIRIPMLASSRSLNLSNATAIIIYEAWRQNNFNNIKDF